MTRQRRKHRLFLLNNIILSFFKVTLQIGVAFMICLLTTIIFINMVTKSRDGFIIPVQVLGDIASTAYSHSEPAKALSYLCGLHNNTEARIRCVTVFLTENSKYNKSKELHNLPEMLVNGYDCKTASTFYCSVFKNWEWRCYTKTTENHMITMVVPPDKMYCIVDQGEFVCV